jgi:hypothetical protein
VPLPDPADGGVAGHLTKRFDTVRKQQRPTASPRTRKCSFGAGVTAADNDDVEFSGEKHKSILEEAQ